MNMEKVTSMLFPVIVSAIAWMISSVTCKGKANNV